MNTQKIVFSKLSEKKKVDLSLISDYESKFDEVLELDRSITSSLTLLSEKASDVLNRMFEFEKLYDDLLSMEVEAEIKYSRLSDIMQEVEMKAEELGAAPFEFMPNYAEAVDILDTQFVGQYHDYDADTSKLLQLIDR